MVHGREHLRQTAHLSEQTHADILDAADETYATLAREFSRPIETVHRGLCIAASESMEKELQARGHPAVWVPLRRAYHFYVQLPSELAEGAMVGIDATWQQFLGKSIVRPELPKVLIGTNDEIIEAARSYGVLAPKLDAFRPRLCQAGPLG